MGNLNGRHMFRNGVFFYTTYRSLFFPESFPQEVHEDSCCNVTLLSPVSVQHSARMQTIRHSLSECAGVLVCRCAGVLVCFGMEHEVLEASIHHCSHS